MVYWPTSDKIGANMWQNILDRKIRRTTVLILLCISFLVGVGAAKSGRLVDFEWALLFVVPAIFGLVRRSWLGIVFIVLFGLSMGWWRGSVYMMKLADIAHYYNQKVTITAVASQDGAYNKYQQLAIDARHVTVLDTGEKIKGKISISGMGLNGIFAGDTIQATGKFKSSLGSYQGRMSFAQLKLVSHHDTFVNELRRKFTSGMESALPEPAASFGMGLLIGQRNNLPAEVSQDLLMIGLTHIIAVSGYNLTILLRSSNKLLAKRSKRQATFLALALIALFLLFAGTSASIVRAAIVSTLSILAGYYGRSFKPMLLITLTAAITVYASPFYLWSDSGWALSFLAFFGIMVLSPLISRNWPERIRESILISVALESVCAELMATPYILHMFAQISFMGLVGNILVATLVPLAMLVGMIAGLGGMLLPAIAGWLAWPAKIVLTYMLDMANILSHLPHVFAQNLSFSWTELIAWYAILLSFTAALRFQAHRKSDKITDINIAKHTGVQSPHVRSQQMVNN